MAAISPIRELDTLIDPAKLGQMQDFQLGWFWKIFLTLRMAPGFRLPFDDQFWSLTGARTRGFWLQHCAPVLACYERQSIAGQTWIWHSELVRLAQAGSQFGNKPAHRDGLFEDLPKKDTPPIYELFLVAYKNYPKHVEKQESQRKFLLAVKKHAKDQKIPETDSAEFIAHKCAEYAAVTRNAGMDRQFIPSMAKWLHRGRYLDDPSEWAVSYKLPQKESTLKRNLDALERL